MGQLKLTDQQDFETAVSATVKRHQEEEIQFIKKNFAKIVSVLKFQHPLIPIQVIIT